MSDAQPATPDAAPGADAGPRTDRGAFRRRYGAGGRHLAGLLACFAVAGYAALRWVDEPTAVRLVVWFVGSAVLHDAVLFPLYALADRLLRLVAPTRGPGSRRVGSRRPVPIVNHVRVPAVFAGLLLLLWFPLILSKPEPAYRSATGLDTAPYLGRWLLVTAVLFGVSALAYAVRLVRASGSSPRSGAEANSTIPSSNDTDADQPRS